MRDNWEKVNLFEIAKNTPNSFVDGDWIESPYIVNEGIRLIQTGNIGVGFFKNNSKKYISEESFKQLQCKEVFPGDILICRLAEPAGRACIVPDLDQRFITSVDVSILRVDSNFSKSLIHHLLNTKDFLAKVELLSGGSTRQRISRTNLGNIRFDIPPLPQQRKIARILTTCDTVIEKTEAAIAKYRAIKQGMMHDLFTRGIVTEDTTYTDKNGKVVELHRNQLRPKYEEAPELYKESELGWIPREWEVKTINSFASQRNYAIVDGPFGSNLKTIHYRAVGYPIIQSGFVTSNEFNAEKYLYVDKEKYFTEIRSSVKAGDIIMAKIGAQCGTCAILPDNHLDGIIAGNCLKITVDKNNDSKFLLHLLHQYRKIGKLDLITSTTAQPAISMSSLKIMKIPYALLNEQELISKSVELLIKKIQTEQSTLSKYRQIKAGLMQDLLSGEVEVKV